MDNRIRIEWPKLGSQLLYLHFQFIRQCRGLHRGSDQLRHTDWFGHETSRQSHSRGAWKDQCPAEGRTRETTCRTMSNWWFWLDCPAWFRSFQQITRHLKVLGHRSRGIHRMCFNCHIAYPTCQWIHKLCQYGYGICTSWISLANVDHPSIKVNHLETDPSMRYSQPRSLQT